MFKVFKLFAMYDSWIAGRILLIKFKKAISRTYNNNNSQNIFWTTGL